MIRLMKSTFYKEEETKYKLAEFIKMSNKLSMGSECSKFEEKFSEHQGRKFAVFFNSGSSANLALVSSLFNMKKLKKSDKVGFSSVTWSTNVTPLIQLDLQPIPIDISLDNININSENLLDILSKNDLKALFITNLFGFSGDIDEIKKICEKRNIILLEDNCESLGSRINNIKLGNFGLASTFSFFVGHHLSTIEGGMVCTDDEELSNMLKIVRSHGLARGLNEKVKNKLKEEWGISDFNELFTFYALGYNLRPTEIGGYLGMEQLKYVEEIYKIRNINFKILCSASKNNQELVCLDLSHMDFVSNFVYPVICKTVELAEKYRKNFIENDVEIRPIVGGDVIEQPFFKEYAKSKGLKFNCENAKKIAELGFYIPNNPELSETELGIMCKILGGLS